MLKYAYNPDPKRSAKVYGRNLRISTKSSVTLCRTITGMKYEKGKKFLEDLINRKKSLNGKYYTKTAAEILNILESARNNAEVKDLDVDKLFIHASAHSGFKFYTPRRFKLRRRKAKNTNIQIVLEEK
jgi:ribosomal protein L22